MNTVAQRKMSRSEEELQTNLRSKSMSGKHEYETPANNRQNTD